VIEELLAVVGQEHDQRVVVAAARLQLAHEAAELLVSVRDVAVVLRDHPLAVERLLVVGARVHSGVVGGRLRLPFPVERRRRRVRHVRVHGVDVQKGWKAAVRVEELERRVHHRRRGHVLRGAPLGVVQADEAGEALLEVRTARVDHRVRYRGAGREALRLQHLGERHVAEVERIAQLHGQVPAREQRREQRRDAGLGPGRLGDRALEEHCVLGEARQLRRGVARVAVGAGVVGAKRVHQVHDHERGLAPGGLQRRGAPERAARVVPWLEAARLEDQLRAAAREAAEVQIRRLPGAVRRLAERVEQAQQQHVLAPAASQFHRELHARPLVVLGRDRVGEREPRLFGDVEVVHQPALGGRGQRAVHHVLDPHRLARLAQHPGLVAPRDSSLRQSLGNGQQFDARAGASASGREQQQWHERQAELESCAQGWNFSG
jgi:hypothetical protein